MNCVAIDASKGNSAVATMRPGGKEFILPHGVYRTVSELSSLTEQALLRFI